jgi:hypothetical protein
MGEKLKGHLGNKVNSGFDLVCGSYCEWMTMKLTIDQMVMVAFVVMVIRACT